MSAKTVTVTLGGEDWDVPASYRVAADLCALGIDPLKMAIAARTDGTLPIDFEQLVSVIHVGVKRAGCKLTRDDVGEAIITEMGMVVALEKASEVLTAIVLGGPSAEDANFNEKKPRAARRKTGQG
jgi:hypothetical protein